MISKEIRLNLGPRRNQPHNSIIGVCYKLSFSGRREELGSEP
jgi:hypothetical protein